MIIQSYLPKIFAKKYPKTNIAKRFYSVNYKTYGYFQLFKLSLGLCGFVGLPIYSYKNNLNKLSENDSLIKKFVIYSLYSNVGAFAGFYLPNIILLTPIVSFFLIPSLIPFGIFEMFEYIAKKIENKKL